MGDVVINIWHLIRNKVFSGINCMMKRGECNHVVIVSRWACSLQDSMI